MCFFLQNSNLGIPDVGCEMLGIVVDYYSCTNIEQFEVLILFKGCLSTVSPLKP